MENEIYFFKTREKLMNMIEENLFRSMNRPKAANYNPDEDEPFQAGLKMFHLDQKICYYQIFQKIFAH